MDDVVVDLRDGPLASSRRILSAARAAAGAGARWVVSVSMTDCVLLKVVDLAGIDCDVVFVDTGYHFDETLDYLETAERLFGRRIRRVLASDGTGVDGPPAPEGHEECCRRRKVAPLDAALRDYGVWVTGVRRADSPARSSAPALMHDEGRGVLKVNPLVLWSDSDVTSFESEHHLPRNPLTQRGYTSIGCAPCTVPPVDTAGRSGRWPGSGRLECGLHREFVSPPPTPRVVTRAGDTPACPPYR